ncbi:MAG: molybdenum cofactor guanylyltransferase [Notoacmeibacter sp.]
MKIGATILAGGQSKRLGGQNKALLMLGAKPLFRHVADQLAGQCEIIGINANRDLPLFDLPIVADGIGGALGPLDGILGALYFAEKNGCTHALTVSVDTPFIPADLAEKLQQSARDHIATASSNNKIHGTCSLWPVVCAPGLKTFILSGKKLKLMDYLTEENAIPVPFAGNDPDPFFNINTPDDLAAATQWL